MSPAAAALRIPDTLNASAESYAAYGVKSVRVDGGELVVREAQQSPGTPADGDADEGADHDHECEIERGPASRERAKDGRRRGNLSFGAA